MAKITQPTRYGSAILATVASFALLAASGERALADKPATPVIVVNPDASPVTTNVVNPATNPVPTNVVNPATMPALTSSIDEPGRIPYQSSLTKDCSAQTECFVVFTAPTAPPGHRLVITHISAEARTAANPMNVNVALVTSGPTNEVLSFFAPSLSNPRFGNFISAVDQSVLYFFDPGDGFDIGFELGASTFVNNVLATVTGYLVDCSTASPCAPIAH